MKANLEQQRHIYDNIFNGMATVYEEGACVSNPITFDKMAEVVDYLRNGKT